MAYVIVAVIGAASFALYWWVVTSTLNRKPPPTRATSTVPKPEVHLPVIEASMTLWPGFPINIAPRKVGHFITFADDLTVAMTNFSNDSDAGLPWPGKKGMLESVSVYRFSNHDSVSVFNVRTQLSITFFDQGNGQQQVLKRISKLLVIDSLEPGETFELYAVNKTQHWTDLPLPRSCDLEIQGSTRKVQVNFLPKGPLANDVPGTETLVPPIAPSLHKWSGDQVVGDVH